MESTSEGTDEPVQPQPEGERRVERDEPGTVISESEPGDASRRAVEDWDHAPGDEQVVDFPDAGHREGGIAKQVLEMAPDVAYDVLPADKDDKDAGVKTWCPTCKTSHSREGGIAKQVLAPGVAYNEPGSAGVDWLDSQSETAESTRLEAPRFVAGQIGGYEPVPSLDVEITVVTPDGRSFSFREAREYPDFPDDAEFEISSVLVPLSAVTSTAYQHFIG